MKYIELIFDFIVGIQWPLVIVTLCVIFRKPLFELIRKFKGVEYRRSGEGHELKANFDELKEKSKDLQIEEDVELSPKPISDPKTSILEAYKNLIESAEKKLEELNISLAKENYHNDALSYLSYTGVFSPDIESIIQNIEFIHHNVKRRPPRDINIESAENYLAIVKKIEKIINALDSLPALNLNAITFFLMVLYTIIDSNKHNDISFDTIHKHIEDGTILDFIAEIDETNYVEDVLKGGTWNNFREIYVQSLQSICRGYKGKERRKFGIENSGLCLLATWTNSIIADGSGWHPDKDLLQ